YHSFGEIPDPSSYDLPHTKFIYYPDLSTHDALTPSDNVQVGDRIGYYIRTSPNHDWRDAIQHSAIVTEVDSAGYATKVESKMGSLGVIQHHPRDIPESYEPVHPSVTFTGNGTVTTRYYRIYYRPK